MSKVFLSHTSKDKPFVRKLANDLRSYGHTVWIDEAEINIGDSLIGKIRDGLDSVDFVAAILSKESIESEWVQKELEIASNREIKEKRVVVLPILIDKVDLPGFLEGKLFGDFSNPDDYDEKLQLLLRSLGDSEPTKTIKEDKIDELQKELDNLKKVIESHKSELDQVVSYSLSTKSEKLREKIAAENKSYPEYSPINNVYAFELGDVAITMGYLMHALRKSQYKGGHPLEWVLTLNNKWDEANRMFEAYSEMIKSQKAK